MSQKIPEDKDVLLIPHFLDFIDTPHLFGEKDRLPGIDGTPGIGLKLSEAIPLAMLWWDRNRFGMPDYGKPFEKLVIKSGIMRGLPWLELNKQEMLRVLAQWYANVGIHTIIEGKSTSDDGKIKNMDQIRDDAKKVLPVLDTSCTHAPTTRGGKDDAKEVEAWKEGYEEIEREETLVDAQGEKLQIKKG